MRAPVLIVLRKGLAKVRKDTRNQAQQTLNGQLAAGLRALDAGGLGALLGLAGLSFLYGVLPALGPGHGKAVISANVLADARRLRQGLALAWCNADAKLWPSCQWEYGPCSGAVLVLAFAKAAGAFGAGILPTLAMAVGTAITVSSLALAAFYSRHAALKLAGRGERMAFLAENVLAMAGRNRKILMGALCLRAPSPARFPRFESDQQAGTPSWMRSSRRSLWLTISPWSLCTALLAVRSNRKGSSA